MIRSVKGLKNPFKAIEKLYEKVGQNEREVSLKENLGLNFDDLSSKDN